MLFLSLLIDSHIHSWSAAGATGGSEVTNVSIAHKGSEDSDGE